MLHIVKRALFVLLALSFISGITAFALTHRGVSNVHAASTRPDATTLSVYFGSDNDKFYALTAADGFYRWSYQYPPGGDIWSPAVVVNGVIYFEVSNSSSTAVVSLRSDGSKRWIFTFPAQTYGKSAIAVANGAVYFAVDSNVGTSYIYALNTKDTSGTGNGTVLWTHPAAAGKYFGNPIVANGKLYVAQYPSVSGNPTQLVALNATDGTKVWSPPPALPARPKTNLAESNGVIYFGDVTGSLDAFNETTKSLKWSSQVDGGPISTPTPTSGVIYYASANNFVTAVNASNGSLHWDYSAGKPFAVTVSPVLYSHVIYIGSTNTNMYAINTDGSSFGAAGTLFWKTKIGTPITTTAAVKNNIVHIGLQNGTLRTLNASFPNPGKQRWFYHSNGSIYTSSPPVVI